MKKIIAFALALVMVMSCTLALADDKNMDIEMSDPVEFLSKPETFGKASEASQKTALWLQVAADGQINCTIPLVLIYKTNIDGGYATTDPDNYKIVNNSSADIVVTSVEIEEGESGDAKKMTLAEAVADGDQDTYSGTLTIAKEDVNLFQDGWKHPINDRVLNLFKIGEGTEEKATVTQAEGGVFFIAKNGGETGISVKIHTSPLTFTTKEDDDTNSYGVNLVNVTYTVAIDTHLAYDVVITGTTNASRYVPTTKPTSITKVTYTYEGTELTGVNR